MMVDEMYGQPGYGYWYVQSGAVPVSHNEVRSEQCTLAAMSHDAAGSLCRLMRPVDHAQPRQTILETTPLSTRQNM